MMRTAAAAGGLSASVARGLVFALTVATALAALGPARAFAAPADPREDPTLRLQLETIQRSLDAEDLGAAQRAVDTLAKSVPADAEPLQYFQGRLAFEQGRYPDAISHLKRAGIDDSPGSYLRLAKDTQAAVKDHQTVESAHFIFSFPKGKDAILGPWGLETLEAQRKALEQVFGYAPPGKVRVEVVEDAPELARLSTLTLEQIETTGTIAICKFNKLIITSPKAVASGYDWQDTLAHEFTHLVVTQQGRNQVPIWLQEGFAKYFESSWRGTPGLDLLPATRALLGVRIRANKLVTFAQMHPSMAMLPSAEDAETAFAEVYFAIDFIYREHGAPALRQIVEGMAKGQSDQAAVGAAMGGISFSQFEQRWLAYLKKQPFPKELIPRTDTRPVLKSGKEKDASAKDKGREISFTDFAHVTEPKAREFAHLGELFRERDRNGAAAEEYGKAHHLVGDKYESISNKYALSLLALNRLDTAVAVLKGSLTMHPGASQTHVHLARIYLAQGDFPSAKGAYLDALGEDPFDPEIQVGLLAVGNKLGDKTLSERGMSGAITLLGLSPKQLDAIASRMAQPSKDLSQAPTLSTGAKDAGTPPGPARDGGLPHPPDDGARPAGGR